MAEISRHQARCQVIELAYEASMRAVSVAEVISGVGTVDEFVAELAAAFDGHSDEAKTHIAEHAPQNWPMSRMAAMDIVVMKLAIAELLEAKNPAGAVLSEAVELAQKYSTDDSAKFVNGILSAISAKIG